MEKDRKPGQNGKDGMRRPRRVPREEYENNFQEWLDALKKAKKEETNNKNQEEE